MVKYSKPLEEIAYSEQYSDMGDLIRGWNRRLYVHQGSARISSDKSPIYSEGFSKCSALVLKNADTLETAMFHIDDYNLGYSMSTTFGEFMEHHIITLAIDLPIRDKLILAARDITHYDNPKTMTRKDFQKQMSSLKASKMIKAQFVFGSESRHVRDFIREHMLALFGIDINDDILVNSSRECFGVAYNPNNSDLYVDVRSRKKVLKFAF